MKNEPMYFAPEKKPGGGWICFKDSPTPPPPPDYVGAAQATAAGDAEAARQATYANRVNQVTPYGDLTYTNDPTSEFDQAGYDAAMAKYQRAMANLSGLPMGLGAQLQGQLVAPNRDDFTKTTDHWTSTQTLAPDQQKLLEQTNRTSLGLADLADEGLGYVSDALSNNITAADLPADMVNAGQTGQDALMARFQPQIDQSRKALENQLANQGIMPGSEAYDNAMRTQNQSENDLRMQAALNGINVGQNAQTHKLGIETSLQNQPLNMLNAVRTGSQVTNPTFSNVPQQATTGGPNYMGALQGQTNYGMGLYNSQVAQNNAMQGGLFGLGAAALM